jgi:iron complex outermembrane receptor protein
VFIRHRIILALMVLTAAVCQADERFLEMTLEQLLNVEVTSVSRKSEALSSTAAAIYVLSRDDIRRSGALNIPDALRLVPGVQVSQIYGNTYRVSIRGHGSRFANKLLVLIDGRSVYTEFFSGVFWELHNLPIEYIDHIEVIRGPGATQWGANAVNGVINIITSTAHEGQYSYVQGLGGNLDSELTLGHGGKLSEAVAWRAWGKFSGRDNQFAEIETHDDSDSITGELRLDGTVDNGDTWSLQLGGGDIDSDYSFPTTGSIYAQRFHTVHAVGHWHRDLADNSALDFHVAYHRLNDRAEFYEDTTNMLELGLQHRFKPADRHDVVWGIDYRQVHDDFEGSDTLKVDPAERRTELFSFFVEDEIELTDELRLILGSKFEHNDYTGYEYQPSVRMAWQPEGHTTYWGAVSRAVRTPSRTDHDIELNSSVEPGGPGGLPVATVIFGDEDVDSEELIAYELGWRRQFSESFAVDAALFYHDYDSLRSLEEGAVELTGPPLHTKPRIADNLMDAESYGIELSSRWRPTENWELTTAYSFIQIHAHIDGNDVATEANLEERTPAHSASLWSRWNASERVTMDAVLRYADVQQDVDAYVDFDMRIAWQVTDTCELAIGGRNLLDSHHREASRNPGTEINEVRRGGYASLTWRW